MNIEQFKIEFSKCRDIDEIEIKCDHPDHVGDQLVKIGKQPAKRNILKHDGKEFICRDCYMKHSNPMHKDENTIVRQTDEEITIFCVHPEHQGNRDRKIKKCHYYGSMKEPYLQMCKSCAQKGKKISEHQREAIRMALTGLTRSEEVCQKLSDYMKNNPEGIARGKKNLIPGQGGISRKGLPLNEQWKESISNSMLGKSKTEEHKNNISEGRKKMLEETGGFTQEHRDNIRKATIRQYQKGFDPTSHHAIGYHNSPKAGLVYHRSSYEKKAFLKLDQDELVKTYFVEAVKVSYFHPERQFFCDYLIDIKVEYMDGSFKLIEVKPAKWCEDWIIKEKFKAAYELAEQLGMTFEVWTEASLFGAVYNPKIIKDFADKLKGVTKKDTEIAKNKKAEIQKKKYQEEIRTDRIIVFCEYCKEDHDIMKTTYEKNLKDNGRYICIVENGSIVGSLPKTHLIKENPYAAEGKKQCLGPCRLESHQGIKLFECFGLDKSRRDGYADKCRECRKRKS